MKKNLILISVAAFISISIRLDGSASASPLPSSVGTKSSTETIVLIRHGEKTPTELGQLDCQGLNRALALPDILIGKYGKPDYLFAPNPSSRVVTHNGTSYSYIRPLATIEPTAIRLGLPVNAQIGFTDIKRLQDELTQPVYASSVIFIAWEHLAEDQFAKNIMATYGSHASNDEASGVPDWSSKDYDFIFVIRLMRSGAAMTATFMVDHENLNGKLSSNFPVPAVP